MKTTPYVRRPGLESQIADAAQGRKRLILVGPVGSGRSTVLAHALTDAGCITHQVDLMGILKFTDLDAAFVQTGVAATMSAVLGKIDERAGMRKHRQALVLTNLDGCRGVADESEIVGSLRSQLQMVQNVAVFYTASDPEFVARHFSDTKGAFFKQASILEIGPFNPVNVDELVLAHTRTFLPANVRGLIIDSVGLLPANVAMLIGRLAEARKSDGKPLRTAEVNEMIVRIVRERKVQYELWLNAFLPANQRAVLTAFAKGVPLRATAEMAQASGVPVGSLHGVILGAKRNGCIVMQGDEPAFANPFLRLHLAAR